MSSSILKLLALLLALFFFGALIHDDLPVFLDHLTYQMVLAVPAFALCFYHLLEVFNLPTKFWRALLPHLAAPCLRSQEDTFADTIKKLQWTIEGQAKRLEELLQAVEMHQRRRSDLEDSNLALNRQIWTLQKREAAGWSKVREIAGLLEEQRIRHKHLLVDSTDYKLKQKCDNLDQLYRACKFQRDMLVHDPAGVLKIEEKKHELERSALDKEIESLKGQLEGAQKSKNEADIKLAEQARQLGSQNGRIMAMQGNFHLELQQGIAARTSLLQQELTSAQNELKKKSSDYDQVNELAKNLEADKGVANRDLDNAKRQLVHAADRNQRTQHDLTEAEKSLAKAGTDNASLKEELASLKADFELASSQKDKECAEEKKALSEEIAVLKLHNSSLGAQPKQQPESGKKPMTSGTPGNSGKHAARGRLALANAGTTRPRPKKPAPQEASPEASTEA